MSIISIVILGAVALLLMTIGIAFWQMDKKMKQKLTIEEYFDVVKGFWAQLFGMFFTITFDDEEGAVIALKNIPPYLLSLIEELPVETKRGVDTNGTPVLFIRNNFLNDVLERIHCISLPTNGVNPLYKIEQVTLSSKTVQWVDLMYRFWRDAIRAVTVTEKELLDARQLYQAAHLQYGQQVKAFIKATTEEQDALNNYVPWAQKLYAEIKTHPDILRVSLTEKPGHIIIYTDDLTVTETGSEVRSGRTPRQWLLGKMIIYLHLESGETTYRHENGHMRNSEHQAPHVKDVAPCWGSHSDVVKHALASKNYLKAIQESINFLQYANTGDPWGKTATNLEQLNSGQVVDIQERKLQRVSDARLQNNMPTVSPTSFYIVEDKRKYRKLCKELGIDIDVTLDGSEGYGVVGMLIQGKDINAFLKATLEPGMTVRTDATLQGGVRQITFIEDNEQQKFIDLLVESWKMNRTKVPQTTGKMLQSVQAEVAKTRRNYLRYLLSQHKQTAKITNDMLDAGVMTGVYEEMLRELLSIPEVEEIHFEGERIVITTVDLSMEYKRPRAHKPTYFKLGAVKIIIDLSLESPVSIERVKGRIPNTQFMTPNVIGDGTPLWGIKELQLMQLFAKGNWTEIVKECLAFLSSLKDEQLAKYTAHLPVIDQVIDFEELRRTREKRAEKRLIELPSLLSKPQAGNYEEEIVKLLNQ